MKIVILTPEDHFHSPTVLRALGQTRNPAETFIFTTPKLGSKGSLWLNLTRWIKQSGYDYIISMILLKIVYRWLGFIERFVFRVSFEKKQYLTVREVINHFGFSWHRVRNINSVSSINLINSIQPDLIMVLFFNQIIGGRVMEIPRLGCLNLHPSYLPSYRGVSPCFWTLANNEAFTGVSVHYLDTGIDSGAILKQTRIPIEPGDSFFALYRRCAEYETPLLTGVLAKLNAGREIKETTQDEAQASYFGPITPIAIRRFRKNRRKFGWLC